MRDTLPADIPLREAREFSRALSEAAPARLTQFLDVFDSINETPTEPSMTHKHKLAVAEMGKLRIYLVPTEKIKATGLWSRLNARSVYRELIKAAKQDGLLNAVAYTAHHGFSNNGRVESHNPEMGNPRLAMCVELIDHKHKLEQFCRQHGALLQDKVIVYKHVEHWSVHAHKLSEEQVMTDE